MTTQERFLLRQNAGKELLTALSHKVRLFKMLCTTADKEVHLHILHIELSYSNETCLYTLKISENTKKGKTIIRYSHDYPIKERITTIWITKLLDNTFYSKLHLVTNSSSKEIFNIDMIEYWHSRIFTEEI